jgi:hypothetical protein
METTVAEIVIKEKVWQELAQVARRRRKKPQDLAHTALVEFLKRQADEDLLARSSRAAQKTAFSISDTEEVIRQHRKEKKRP